MKLNGRTVLITGGGTGIGASLAGAFHARGNKVIVTGRREAPLKDLAAKHPGMEIIVSDVSNESEVKAVLEAVSSRFPQLDLLINNAGIMRRHDFSAAQGSEERLFDEIDINLKGLIRMCWAFLPLLQKQKSADIVNVSSGLAYVPLAMTPVYCATKAAVHSFSQSLRYQLRKTSVGVVELAPPAVATDLLKAEAGDQEYPRMKLEDFTAATMEALGGNATELPIGQAKGLRFMSRFFPGKIFGILNPKGA
jgi:uncharacterized oxidoreductase